MYWKKCIGDNRLDYVLENVLGMMDWILYWIMYLGLWIGLLAAFAFFSFPFTSFHVLSCLNYLLSISTHHQAQIFIYYLCINLTLELRGTKMNRK